MGDEAVDALEAEGIDVSAVARVDAPTGVALIVVDAAGENQIAVASGANAALDRSPTLDLHGDGVVLLGHEVSAEVVERAARAANAAGWRVVLNPAPARELPDAELAVLTPNASEAAQLTGEDEPEAAARALAEQTGAAVLITLGSRGALLLEPGGEPQLPAGDEGRRRRHHRRRRHRQRRARRRARRGPRRSPTRRASRSPPRRCRRPRRARAAGCRAATRSCEARRRRGASRGARAVGGLGRAAPARRARHRARAAALAALASTALRAGVISDLHAGVPHVGLPTIRRAVDALNARAPDVHLLLGDYLDASQVLRRDLAAEVVADELARLRAPLGTIAVIGNHDWRNSGDRMWRALEAAGITVLEDRAVAARRTFWVAGLADMRHRSPNVVRALRDVRPARR